jgi:hypothetical protein
MQFEGFVQPRGGQFQRKLSVRQQPLFHQLAVNGSVVLDQSVNANSLISIYIHLYVEGRLDPDLHQKQAGIRRDLGSYPLFDHLNDFVVEHVVEKKKGTVSVPFSQFAEAKIGEIYE